MANIPLSDITVTAFKKEIDTTFTNVGSNTTGSPLGDYEILNLEAGEYTLKFIDASGVYITSYYGGADNLADATLFTVTASTTTTGKNFVMPVAGGVSGLVTGPEIV